MISRSFQTSLACLAFALMAGSGTAQVTTPSAGFVRQRDGALRRLDGTTGSFVLGASVTVEPTLAASFDASGGLIQIPESIALLDASGRELARFDAPPGKALLSGKLAYFPSDGTLWTYSATQSDGGQYAGDVAAVPLNPIEGTVLAIGGSGEAGVTLAVRRDDGVWRLRIAKDGSVASQDALPADASELLFVTSGVVYSSNADIVYLNDETKSEKRWTLTHPVLRLAPMSAASIQADSVSGSFVIRLDREGVFSIPETAAGVTQ